MAQGFHGWLGAKKIKGKTVSNLSVENCYVTPFVVERNLQWNKLGTKVLTQSS